MDFNLLGKSDLEIVMEICQTLKQMRINKNISQQEIAERSGLDRTTISRMESGRSVSLLTLVQVLRALNMLEVFNVFKAYQIESPIKLLKEEEKKSYNHFCIKVEFLSCFCTYPAIYKCFCIKVR